MSSSGVQEGEDQAEKHDFWKAKFEEKEREMQDIEEPKIRRMNNLELQEQVEGLNRRINIVEVRSCGSRQHVELLWEYEETINAQIMRNMQS
jgi:hypothetical protein